VDELVDVVLNVGTNTKSEWGGFRAPIDYDTKMFKFVPIPLKDKFEAQPSEFAPTYGALGLEEVVPSENLSKRALVSPNFLILAYGHIKRHSDGNVFTRLKNEGGTLLFFATFRYGLEKNEWGAFLIGYFKREFVLTNKELYERISVYGKRFEDYSWYRMRDKTTNRFVGASWWISGESGGLFRKAIPLSEYRAPEHWNEFTIKTLRTTGLNRKTLNTSKVAKYNWTLTVDTSEADYFWSEVNKNCGGVRRRLF
jgi:hypothetical protein